jgi:diaminopimelate epimerase
MGIKFTKMHGLGNDFMVIDAIHQSIQLDEEHIRKLSNRYTGIGFDQCLLIEQSQSPNIDFNYRIFNANGQEVGQCGNGARCLALFAQHYGLTSKKTLTVATKTTQMQLTINQNNTVSVDMGIPKLRPEDIPFLTSQQAPSYELLLNDEQTVPIHTINVGNPHAVLLVNDIQTAPVNQLGPQISVHQQFPEQTNTGFMQIINPQHIHLRVFERGCGETHACGSGAVAAAAIGQLYYNLEKQVRVSLLGGELIIDWPHKDASIRLTGPASFVYEATLFDL